MGCSIRVEKRKWHPGRVKEILMRAERGIDRIRGQLIVLAARTPDREDDLVGEVDSLMDELEENYIDALLARIADEDASLVTWDNG